MAFNENSLHRIREILLEKEIDFSEKKMFSGVCIMVDDKMCCGTHIDKKTNEDLLLCRIGKRPMKKHWKMPTASQWSLQESQ
jgi:hypothetical protein